MNNPRENIPAPPAPLTEQQVVEWLDYAMAELIARREQLIPVLNATTQAHSHIADGDDNAMGTCAENVRMGKRLIATSETHRKEQKDPHLLAGRAVDAWFRKFANPITTALLPIEVAMMDFAKRKEAEARAEAASLAEQARQQARTAAMKAALALAGNPTATATQASLEAARLAEARAVKADREASANAAAFTRTEGDYGAVTSITTRWDYEVADITKVPAEYLLENGPAIRQVMKRRDAAGKPAVTIPGIRWVKRENLGVR